MLTQVCGRSDLNLTNLRIWNKDAIAKNYWDVENKVDKLWIRWIHTYYIKGEQGDNIQVPKQACWMIRKILEARTVITQFSTINPEKSVIRQLYNNMLQGKPKVPWKCLMYMNAARPKSKFTTWIQLHGKMLTTDRLSKWGLNVEKTCCLCQLQEESREHLFVQCTYVRRLWDRILRWMSRPMYNAITWEQHLQWTINNGKGNSKEAQVFKMMYAEITYGIWNERNRRTFETRRQQWETIAKEIIYLVV
ncbi:hypothetical protein KY290_005534 [Solanum tuberosum]|uniref:Reverse transcriptase zinc-binding domain-containing protein n=1 Tax=Solanum tuberosum TaxID=4113 RepID=A0ABQ7WEF2_SOLTU|nr:hypothetical protein KY289_005922 [Solanum tuberosum]KAH0752315.1 hypothetical protein KY285_005463 [Solanum tuberosum]KAH0779107.1 hypothetical protein KY290_005534 [Solanum tuberosum]